MLFNSPQFIFGFLPLTLLGFFVLARLGAAAALAWLTLASLFFYAWWNPDWLPLLLLSIAFNLLAGRAIARHRAARGLLAAAIAVNLGALAYFKYAGFLVDTLSGSTAGWQGPELPLGISFFTFTQIAFLVDVYQRKANDFDPVRYGLFVTYYPHLIAGPVLHHKEMMPQFERPDILRFDPVRLADGSVIFILGLFKKTVLADSFGGYARPAFAAAGSDALTFFEAWGAALSYTLQIYFDFSGYSDMAIGLALMIGITLPMNFHSPYKARNIAEFWRRWHMTLSRFLRDYLSSRSAAIARVRCGARSTCSSRCCWAACGTARAGPSWSGARCTARCWCCTRPGAAPFAAPPRCLRPCAQSLPRAPGP
jgi:alginate O-acetyltransferase complex protein AlgI